MGGIFEFLWGHPSLTAILAYVILYIVLSLRSSNRQIDQSKDNVYGPAKGSYGRLLDREKKERNDALLFTISRYALILFLIYRLCKTAHWI